MRAVGVVSQLGREPGLYVREGLPEQATVDAWKAYVAVAGTGVAAYAAPAFFGVGGFSGAVLKILLDLYKNERRPLKRVEHALLPSPSASSAALPSRAIIIPSAGLAQNYSDYDDPVFHGLFESASALESLMASEGGHSELLIVDQDTANTTFHHAGGGRFATGLYLPHPKDGAVLVPVREFSEFVRSEVLSEWVKVFEALGAKRVILTDTTSGKLIGGAAVANPGGSVSAEIRAAYGEANVQESTYAAGSFDPDRALQARRWLGDHPEILGIVEGRTKGRQTSWRKSLKVDCSFGVSGEFLVVATATKGAAIGDVELLRTYDLFVEFHPKD